MRRSLVGIVVAAALTASVVVVGGSTAGATGQERATPAAEEATCDAVDLAMPSGRVVGDLCRPTAGSDTLVVTAAGGTYGRVYWDFPYQPENYSFVHAMVNRGYAVLNIDRLGIGESERPPSVSMTVEHGARSIHEVVEVARSGDLSGGAFERVVLAGHSVGSAVIETEAATYGDVDAVLVTGLSHNLNELNVVTAFGTFRPAALDPRFAGSITDPGYLTTAPDTRASSFYYVPNTDPGVIAVDEATKETISLGELATLYPFMTPGLLGGGPLCSTLSGALRSVCEVLGDPVVSPTPQIDVPVFFVIGSNDGLLCGLVGTDCSTPATVQAAEAPYWTGAPCFDVQVVAGAGHNLNLHRNAQTWYQDAAGWLDSLPVGADGSFDCP